MNRLNAKNASAKQEDTSGLLKRTLYPAVLLCLAAVPVAFAQTAPTSAQATGVRAPMQPVAAQGQTPMTHDQTAVSGNAAKTRTTQIPWGPGGLQPTVVGGSYAMLTQLQQQEVLLDQELKIAQKTKELQDLEKSGNSDSSGSDSSDGSSIAALAVLGGEPRVLLVEGRPGKVRAMLSLPSGGTIMAKAGDAIPQVGRIVSISANTVLVRSKKNKVTSIPFWSSYTSAPSSSSNSGFAAMPPPIPAQPRANQASAPPNGVTGN